MLVISSCCGTWRESACRTGPAVSAPQGVPSLGQFLCASPWACGAGSLVCDGSAPLTWQGFCFGGCLFLPPGSHERGGGGGQGAWASVLQASVGLRNQERLPMSPKSKGRFQVIGKDMVGTENSLGKGAEMGPLRGASVGRPAWAVCWHTRFLAAAAGPNPGKGRQHPLLRGVGCQVRTLDPGRERGASASQGSSQA